MNKSINLNKIDHIGMAVYSLEKWIPFYRDVLKLNFLGMEEIASQGVRVACFEIGESKIELLSPIDIGEGAVAKFLAQKGEGIHHYAYHCAGGESALLDLIEELKAQGYSLINSVPSTGAHGKKIVFLHPKSCGGALIEICAE